MSVTVNDKEKCSSDNRLNVQLKKAKYKTAVSVMRPIRQQSKENVKMAKTVDYLPIVSVLKRVKNKQQQQQQHQQQIKKLHRAVITNNTEAVLTLLSSNENIDVNDGDELDRRALHLAASRGYKQLTQLLLEAGADPNARDIVGNTPLHLAACTHNLDLVTLLLNAGADVTSLDRRGCNPLHLAQSKLRLLLTNRQQGRTYCSHLRLQLQQVVDLMCSYLRLHINTNTNTNTDTAINTMIITNKQNMINNHLHCMLQDRLNRLDCLDNTQFNESQLDDQVTFLLDAIQHMSIK